MLIIELLQTGLKYKIVPEINVVIEQDLNLWYTYIESKSKTTQKKAPNSITLAKVFLRKWDTYFDIFLYYHILSYNEQAVKSSTIYIIFYRLLFHVINQRNIKNV